MVFVKVRETYDLHTTRNKMTVIGIHTPKPDIIKRNYPGLLMQCRAYRPHSCDVRIACASVLPLDPLGVGTTENDVAPEDVFNPILYKAMSNKGMSQLEARINQYVPSSYGTEVKGQSALVDVDSFTGADNDFNAYYGLLADTNGWRHAHPQAGLQMTKLKPLVYEMVYNVGDTTGFKTSGNDIQYSTPDNGDQGLIQHNVNVYGILGKAKEMPFINCTSYDSATNDAGTADGFPSSGLNAERTVPYLPVIVAGIIIPPSRLHEMYFRMVVEWTIEFSSIRSLIEITDFPDGMSWLGSNSHYQNYTYSRVKEAVTGTDETILEKDTCMVSSNVDIDKVM